MNEERNEYADFIKLQRREMHQVQQAYQHAVAWLAFSALLNLALFGAWLFEVMQ